MIEMIIGGILLVVLGGWFFTTWNRLVRLEKEAERSWANIDVILKQRYDMIPNLVNTVRDMRRMKKRFSWNFKAKMLLLAY